MNQWSEYTYNTNTIRTGAAAAVNVDSLNGCETGICCVETWQRVKNDTRAFRLAAAGRLTMTERVVLFKQAAGPCAVCVCVCICFLSTSSLPFGRGGGGGGMGIKEGGLPFYCCQHCYTRPFCSCVYLTRVWFSSSSSSYVYADSSSRLCVCAYRQGERRRRRKKNCR